MRHLRPQCRPAGGPPAQDMGQAQRRIGEYLEGLRFKRALFGVSEEDVWRKLAQVEQLFQQALAAERARYEALLEAGGNLSPKESGEGGTDEGG